ncbi:hypothetical protein [uncultured Tenacibaculum sp.]|uniref:hypothetical protein n=1 Tax=uncultured Tenacibaculum sp. TaxID=174713 RepID=UPI002633F195|nr:hypothetical protein [uncultured Tenacibaculum sp.]
MSKDKNYKKKFEESELLSDRIKKDKSSLVKDLEEKAEKTKKEFKNEIKNVEFSELQKVFGQFALS